MADPIPKKTPPTPKGKPMGIPIWGWVIAAVIGIVVGYTVLKKSPASGFDSSSDSSNSDPLGMTESEKENAPAGGIALEDILKALGLRGSTSVTPGPDSDSGESFSEESSAPSSAPSAEETYAMETFDNPNVDDEGYLPGMNPHASMNDAFSGQFPITPGSTFGPSFSVDYSSTFDPFNLAGSGSQLMMPGSSPVSTSTPASAPAPAPAPVYTPTPVYTSPGGAGSRTNIPM